MTIVDLSVGEITSLHVLGVSDAVRVQLRWPGVAVSTAVSARLLPQDMAVVTRHTANKPAADKAEASASARPASSSSTLVTSRPVRVRTVTLPSTVTSARQPSNFGSKRHWPLARSRPVAVLASIGRNGGTGTRPSVNDVPRTAALVAGGGGRG